MYKHACLKCQSVYEDNDPDPYYCANCNAERKAIAAEVDKKLALRPKKKVVSDLEAFEATAQTYTGANGRTITFQKVKL